ncbi:MAG: SDR family oxidoreductase [Flavobacteriales bacterium]|nr:SDR family oxidoreductase [Flavobacteriales bacterium]
MKKTILLIGSSGGLGKELTKHLGDKGYDLALHYHNNEPKDAGYKTYQADICNEAEVKDMIDAVMRDFGRIDIVINNAGISKSEISWKANIENWNQTMGVNLTGPFLISKHVIPHMRNQNFGRIIFMSSVVAETGMIGTAAYAASKAGLFGLSRTLAKEVANKGITVNAIALGYFNAGMIDDVSEELQEVLKQQIPKGKLGEPIELAELINYLISENAAYLTGQTLNLNGGLYS